MRFSKWSDLKKLDPIVEKARKRVSTLSTHDILNWADSAGSGMAKAFDDFRKWGEAESLEELEQAVKSLTAVVEELKARHDVVR